MPTMIRFEHLLRSAITISLLIVSAGGYGSTALAAENGDALQAPSAAGYNGLQNVLRRMLSNWRRDSALSRSLSAAGTTGSFATHPAAISSRRQPIRFRPLALTNDNYIGPAAGNWNKAANWSTGVVPNNSGSNTFNVFIDNANAQHSVVTLDINPTITNLTIDSDDTLNIANATVLTIAGTSIANAGSLNLNSSANATELIIGAPSVTLSGSGTLTMSNNASNSIFGSIGTDTLTNQETIQGAGNIGAGQMTLVNSGTINANQSAGLTIQATGTTSNTGTIEATAGPLTLVNTTVTNTGAGKITDSGQTLKLTNSTINGGTVTLTGASTLQLNTGTIHGGSTLTNSTTGTIEALGFTNNTLGGAITNPAGGVIKIDNGAVLNLENGSYPNSGAVQMNSTANTTELVVAGANVTLSGGSVTLSNNAANIIFGAAGTDTLTNQETIQGAGNIGDGFMTLVNSGTINANQSAGLTIQAIGTTSNTGTIEATAGPLTLVNTTVTNTGAGKVSDSGQKLELSNSTINGGAVTLTGASTLQLNTGTIHGGSTLTNSTTGTIEALGFTNNTLGGTITNPAGGVIKIDNGAVLNLENGSYPNSGAVQMNSTANTTELVVAGANVTLSGGSVTLSNNAANIIFGAAAADTLTNQETIQGAGNIGDGFMTLVNSGTINANQSAGLTIQATGTTSNTGTIEATAGPLTLVNTTVTNTGAGKITDSGQKLELSNSTINGGTVTLTGASTLQLSTGTIHGGSTLTNSTTGTIEAVGFTNNTLGGTITNPAGGVIKIDNGAVLNLENGSYPNLGAVQLNSTANGTELLLAGAASNVTLSGGSVTMSNNASNLIFGAAGSDTLTNQETIQGAGNIGEGQMILVNSGTINANQSAGLTIQATGTTSNTGTIEATAGPLTLTNMTVTNAGGKITDNGQKLELTNSTVNGGTVTLTGASTLQLNSGTIHAGSTLTSSATGTIEALGFTTNTLGGTITNPAGGVIKIDNGAFLNLENGSYPNLGAVQLNSTGNGTELLLAGTGSNVTLSGGSVTLSNNAQNFIFGAAGNDTLTNQETIQGAGNIGDGQMTLVNSGTINANQSAGLTIQTSGGTTNTGTLEATAGPLTLVNTTVTNTGAGKITDSGQKLELTSTTINGGTVTLTGASTLQLNSGTIHAGSTLTSSATGTIEALGFTTNTLGGTIINPAGGVIKIDNGAFLNLENGSYPNLGAVQLNSTANGTELLLAGTGSNVTLSGGTVTMSNNANNFIFGASATNILTTSAETIQGAGNIGNASMGFVNGGTVIANQSVPLIIQPSSAKFNNKGTLSVSSGDVMHVEGSAGTFTNFSGSTLTGGTYSVTGKLQIDQLGSTGGEILTDAANITLNGSTSSFVDSAGLNALSKLNTIAAASTFALAGGENYTTAGNFTNNGTLTVGAGSKFDVNGNLTNFSGTTNTLTGGIYNDSGSLQFNGANIVTNAANITLTGATSQIIDQTSANGLRNFAINAATGVFSLAGRNLTTAGAFSNAGTLNIGSGSKFLATTGFTQSSTGTTSYSGTLETAGTTTIAGKLTNTAGGTLQLDSGTLTINPGTGGFHNLGTLTVGTGATMKITGPNPFVNFSGSTLTGGSYKVTGTLGFDNANIVTNAANITLSGTLAKIVNDLNSANALTNFTTNAAAGALTLSSSQSLTTAGGSVSNAGKVDITSGSKLTVGNGGNASIAVNYTQTAGSTQVDGTLTSSAATSTPTLNLNGGTLIGDGTLGYSAVVDASGTITPGDSKTQTGKLADTGTYAQNSTGSLGISIGGTTVGTQYDQFNISKTAALNGTLNISLVNGFVPTIGQNFTILNYTSKTGTFSTVNGLGINNTEHFTINYNGTNVVLTVVAGAAAPASVLSSALRPARMQSGLRGRFGVAHPVSMLRPASATAFNASPIGLSGATFAAAPAAILATVGPRPGTASRSFTGLALPHAAGFRSALNQSGVAPPRRLEYGVDLRALIHSPKQFAKTLFTQPGSVEAANLSYLVFTNGSH